MQADATRMLTGYSNPRASKPAFPAVSREVQVEQLSRIESFTHSARDLKSGPVLFLIAVSSDAKITQSLLHSCLCPFVF